MELGSSALCPGLFLCLVKCLLCWTICIHLYWKCYPHNLVRSCWHAFICSVASSVKTHLVCNIWYFSVLPRKILFRQQISIFIDSSELLTLLASAVCQPTNKTISLWCRPVAWRDADLHNTSLNVTDCSNWMLRNEIKDFHLFCLFYFISFYLICEFKMSLLPCSFFFRSCVHLMRFLSGTK